MTRTNRRFPNFFFLSSSLCMIYILHLIYHLFLCEQLNFNPFLVFFLCKKNKIYVSMQSGMLFALIRFLHLGMYLALIRLPHQGMYLAPIILQHLDILHQVKPLGYVSHINYITAFLPMLSWNQGAVHKERHKP